MTYMLIRLEGDLKTVVQTAEPWVRSYQDIHIIMWGQPGMSGNPLLGTLFSYQRLLSIILQFKGASICHHACDISCFSTIIHRMKIQKKLNSKTLRYLLSASMHHLNLEGCFLTNGALKAIWARCPALRSLSLKDCGYVVTDNVMQQLLKVRSPWKCDAAASQGEIAMAIYCSSSSR